MSYDPKENIRLTESDDYTEALKNHLKIYKEQITNDIEITEINLIEGNNIICKVKPQIEELTKIWTTLRKSVELNKSYSIIRLKDNSMTQRNGIWVKLKITIILVILLYIMELIYFI